MKEYSIGLDQGVASIGFVGIDDQNHVMRAKGKNVIGARLFDEGESAAERRGFRTTRRRLNHRKWRLRFLREIFEPHINPVDESFFMRLKESSISPKDSRKHFSGDILFNDKSDQEFYHEYPTIYHLRSALMTQKRKFDIREIYLAIHHIVKYRGHFLEEGSADAFQVGNLDLNDKFKNLNELFQRFDPDQPFQLRLDNLEAVKEILINKDMSAADRQRQLTPKIYIHTEDKNIEKQFKEIATEVLKVVVGNKAKFDVIANVNLDKETKKLWSFTLDSDGVDEKLAKISDQLSEDAQEVIEILKNLFSLVRLANNLPDGMGLSESMKEKYQAHALHLKKLKKLMNQMADKEKAENLQKAYDGYIDGRDSKPLPADSFYSEVKKNLDDSADSQEILKLIESDEFMPKQRSKENGWIPHQLQQKELDAIIENQKDFYPWLAELNPNPDKTRQRIAKYKLDELVTFRIPYYVGPLVSPNGHNKTEAKFSWMVRKDNTGNITPWNFDQKVDRAESASKFISRMTTMDTYLLGEDVLPAHSMIYQKYEVLNELNKIRINDKKIEIDLKQKVYRNLFETRPVVTIKDLKNYLAGEGGFGDKPEISGLSDEKKFLSGLTTYHDFVKVFGRDLVRDPEKQGDLEKIIKWSTVFEDQNIYKEKLNTMAWLTEDEKNQLVINRYRGWGKLSKKLLVDLRDGSNHNQNNVLDNLWNSNDNFMQIQSRNDFAEMIAVENKVALKDASSIEDVIDDMYTSPQNKKAIRQMIRVVKDIQKAFGKAPKRIFVEFAREDQINPRRSIQRQRQVELAYKKVVQEILVNNSVRAELKAKIAEKQKFHDRLFLYFMQGGIDIYTGKRINIDRLSAYDIDHILPRAFIFDNSLDNRVLTSKKTNREKSDSLPRDLFGQKMGNKWLAMKDNGLISKAKYDRLTMNPTTMSAHSQQGFINRQLVETRQVIKLSVELLANEFADEETEIIAVKAGLTHQMREDFGLIKNRDVNDYHHAFDAYLTAFVGQYLLKRYPKLRSYFVYGEFKKFSQKDVKLRSFNFLHNLRDVKPVIDAETGEILWDKEKDIAYIKHLFAYKKILVSREVTEKNAELFNQTLYKATDDKKSGKGSKMLIRAKNKRPTELYGGYTGKTSGFMALVKLIKRKKITYRIAGIPTAELPKLLNLESDSDKGRKRVYDVLMSQFESKTDEFKVIVPKIRYHQLVLDDGNLFFIGSHMEKHNAVQLVLSDSALASIPGSHSLPKNLDRSPDHILKGLDDAYDEIVSAMEKYFQLYDASKFKLDETKKIYQNLPVRDTYKDGKVIETGQQTILSRIVQALHANATRTDLSVLKLSSSFGRFNQRSGIELSKDAQLIYQSPTGLFERRVRIEELDK